MEDLNVRRTHRQREVGIPTLQGGEDVKIYPTGRVEYGPGFDPDDTARRFWLALTVTGFVSWQEMKEATGKALRDCGEATARAVAAERRLARAVELHPELAAELAAEETS